MIKVTLVDGMQNFDLWILMMLMIQSILLMHWRYQCSIGHSFLLPSSPSFSQINNVQTQAQHWIRIFAPFLFPTFRHCIHRSVVAAFYKTIMLTAKIRQKRHELIFTMLLYSHFGQPFFNQNSLGLLCRPDRKLRSLKMVFESHCACFLPYSSYCS